MTLTQILQKIRSAFYTKVESDDRYLKLGGGGNVSSLTISGKNIALDDDVVHNSGDETISGVKTFIEDLCITANNFDPSEASDTGGWFSNALRFWGKKGGLLGTLQGYKLSNNKNRMKLFVRNKDGVDGTFDFNDDGSFFARSIFGGANSIDCTVDSQGNNWIRYSSGIQICWGSANGGGNNITTVFHKAFNTNKMLGITLVPISGNSGAAIIPVILIDFNGTSFSISCGYSGNYIAIGYWK